MNILISTLQKHRKSVDCFLLFICSFFFCHRFLGIHTDFRGDLLQNLYFEVHRELLKQDYNPFQWAYTSFLPSNGTFNPLVQGLRVVLSPMATSFSPEAFAYTLLFATNISLLTLLACGVYLLFRSLNFTAPASFVATTFASFTGFHTSALREFNHMYLASYAALPYFINLQIKMVLNRTPYLLFPSALLVGFGLLGGTHSPFFYIFPVIFVLPFLYFSIRDRKCYSYLFFQLCSVMLGVGLGTKVVLPGRFFYELTNRSNHVFSAPAHQIKDVFYSSFLRDFWQSNGIHFHERDYFWGITGVTLFLWGLLRTKKTKLALFFCFVFLWGLITSQYVLFPSVIQSFLSFYFSKLAIFNPNRLFTVATLGASFFVASAVDQLYGQLYWQLDRRFFKLLIVVIMIQTALSFQIVDIHPHFTQSFVVSVTLGIMSCVALSFKRAGWLGTGLFFFSLALTPIQDTLYPISLHKENSQQSNRWVPWTSFLGLNWNFSMIMAEAKSHLRIPVKALSPPATLKGKVLDIRDLHGRPRFHFYAPISKHRFAFAVVGDPASPIYEKQLADRISEPILDMAGICTLLVPPYETPIYRPGCLPTAYLVPQLKSFSTTQSLLSQMEISSTNDFEQTVFVLESERPVQYLSTINKDPHRQLTTYQEHLLPLRFEVSQQIPSYLFLSIPFRPDWEIRINGQNAKYFRANHAYMAVWIPGGKSHIQLTLPNPVHRWATFISIGSAGIILIGLFLGLGQISLNALQLKSAKVS